MHSRRIEPIKRSTCAFCLGEQWSGRAISDTQATQTSLHDFPMDGITVSNEIFRCLIPGKRLDNLLRDPLRSRMRRHRMMNQPPPTVA